MNVLHPQLQKYVTHGCEVFVSTVNETVLVGGQKFVAVKDRKGSLRALSTVNWDEAVNFLSDLVRDDVQPDHLGNKLREELEVQEGRVLITHPDRPNQGMVMDKRGERIHLNSMGEATVHNTMEEVWKEFCNWNHQYITLTEETAMAPYWFTDDEVSIFPTQSVSNQILENFRS